MTEVGGSIDALEQRIEQLEEALQTRSAIARAQGMLMERYSLDEDAAIALLIRISNTSNLRVRDLARRILDGARVNDLNAASRATPRAPDNPFALRSGS